MNWSELKGIKKGDWTLFLDRDGVINERLIGDYVKSIDEFKFLPGVLEAINYFSKSFQFKFVVTNQQGIGKKLMTESNLHEVHDYMMKKIEENGGEINRVYFAPQLASENSEYRKPRTGMGLLAQKEFNGVDFSKSLMIGDSESDIEFGLNLGMKTILLTNNKEVQTKALFICESLLDVKNKIQNL